jgi:hypothetical protein
MGAIEREIQLGGDHSVLWFLLGWFRDVPFKPRFPVFFGFKLEDGMLRIGVVTLKTPEIPTTKHISCIFPVTSNRKVIIIIINVVATRDSISCIPSPCNHDTITHIFYAMLGVLGFPRTAALSL